MYIYKRTELLESNNLETGFLPNELFRFRVVKERGLSMLTGFILVYKLVLFLSFVLLVY